MAKATMWFKKRMEIRVEPTVRFLRGQDGQAALELKSALLTVLQSHPVRRAYLAQIDFGDGSSPSVALCLSAEDSKTIVKAVQQEVRKLLPSNQYLDICFLSEQQETELAAVCHPFYVAA